MAALRLGDRAGVNRLRWRRLEGRTPAWLAAALFLAVTQALPARASEPIVVFLDQARIMQLPPRAATVVVGNPLIADLTVGPNGVAVVTGKGYGETNFVVLDRSGAVLMEKPVEVKWPNENLVVVYRGIDRETYSCTPDCSRRIMLGDVPGYFDKTLGQTVDRDARISAVARSGR